MTSLATIQPLVLADPPITRPHLGVVGATRTGLMLMPDEARRIDDKLTEVLTSQARIEAKMDAFTVQKDDHEKRLRTLETWRLLQVGAALAAGTGGGALVKLLSGQ